MFLPLLTGCCLCATAGARARRVRGDAAAVRHAAAAARHLRARPRLLPCARCCE